MNLSSGAHGKGRRKGVLFRIPMSKTVSRVLYWTVIYLGGLLPDRSSHLLENSRAGLMFSHGVAPDRVYSIGQSPADG